MSSNRNENIGKSMTMSSAEAVCVLLCPSRPVQAANLIFLKVQLRARHLSENPEINVLLIEAGQRS
jgi:hypothetical protein